MRPARPVRKRRRSRKDCRMAPAKASPTLFRASFAADPAASAGAAIPRARQPHAHAVRPRSRPDHPHPGIPAAEGEDPGLRRPRGRPFPHPADPFARGFADRPLAGQGAGPRRRPDRSRRARPRPRPPAVRAHRRGGAGRGERALGRLRPQCPDVSGRDRARAALPRLRRAEPDLGNPRGRAQAQRADRRPYGAARRGGRSPASTPITISSPATYASAEAQAAAIADDIAYNNHDVDDGLQAELFRPRGALRRALDRADPGGAQGRAARPGRADGAARGRSPHDRRHGRRRARADRSQHRAATASKP